MGAIILDGKWPSPIITATYRPASKHVTWGDQNPWLMYFVYLLGSVVTQIININA